jgi:hypothetical protein
MFEATCTRGTRNGTQHNQALASASKAVELYGYMTRGHYEDEDDGQAKRIADLLVDLAEEYGEDTFGRAVEYAAEHSERRGVDLGALVVSTFEVVEVPTFDAPAAPWMRFLDPDVTL